MKKIALTRGLTACALLLAVSSASAGTAMKSASGWFDFKDCDFCKNLGSQEGLLEHTTWESHPISNGVVNIATVPAEYAAKMATAETAMAELGSQIQSGQVNPMTLRMCTRCQTFGMILMGGKMDMERVEGDAAILTLMTSDDEATVKQLHDMAARDTKELALMAGGH